MSIRSSHGNAKNSSTAIEFSHDFQAASATKNDETVGQIMQRLDQLTNKIASQPEQAPRNPSDLQARVAALERIHEDTLQKLATKLEAVEKQAGQSRQAEALLGKISSKFNNLESKLEAHNENNTLIESLANKFSKIESRIQTANQLHDRVSRLESRIDSHSDHSARLAQLEARPVDPEQEKVLARIHSKLDQIDKQRGKPTPKFEEPLGAENNDRIKYLQSRINKLKELRSRYDDE